MTMNMYNMAFPDAQIPPALGMELAKKLQEEEVPKGERRAIRHKRRRK